MTESISRIYLNHSVNEILGFHAHYFIEIFLFRPLYFSTFNISINFHLTRALKRNFTSEHFEKNTTKSPDVKWMSLFFFINHFGREVIQSSDISIFSLKNWLTIRISNRRTIFINCTTANNFSITKINKL